MASLGSTAGGVQLDNALLTMGQGVWHYREMPEFSLGSALDGAMIAEIPMPEESEPPDMFNLKTGLVSFGG